MADAVRYTLAIPFFCLHDGAFVIWSICNYRAYMSTILISSGREFLVINGPANLGEYI
jgi:hypothetical protein